MAAIKPPQVYVALHKPFVFVREGPSTKAPMLGILRPAQTLTAGASKGGWLRTAEPYDKGRFGWALVDGTPLGLRQLMMRKDDLDQLVPNPSNSGVVTGRRAKLPARPPPYPNSTAVKAVVLHPKMEIGINGDEFPITWDQDGNQYTGAGDNSQPGESGSPLAALLADPTWKVASNDRPVAGAVLGDELKQAHVLFRLPRTL